MLNDTISVLGVNVRGTKDSITSTSILQLHVQCQDAYNNLISVVSSGDLKYEYTKLTYILNTHDIPKGPYRSPHILQNICVYY